MAMREPASDAMPADAVGVQDAAAKKPWLGPLNQRRWRNFKRNRRAYWSLWIFGILFGLSLFAEFLALVRSFLVDFIFCV